MSKKNITYFILAVVLATAFFAHESVLYISNEAEIATSEWQALKAKRTIALDAIKTSVEGTPLYDAYYKEKIASDIAYNKLLNILESEKFLGFNNKKQFLSEFGWALGLFIYALFNLVLAFIEKPKTLIGKVFLHITLLTIALFYLRWCFFKSNEDYLAPKYIAFNILTAGLILIATYFFVSVKTRYGNMLQEKIKDLVAFLFVIRNNHYSKVAKKALHSEKNYPPIDGVSTKTQIDDFENDLWNKIEETQKL